MSSNNLNGESYTPAPPDVRRLAASNEIALGPRETTLGDYWRILLKRKWTVLIAAVAVVGVAAIVSVRTTPVYDSSVRISFASSQSSNILTTSASQAIQISGADLETQSRIIQATSLAKRVIDKLHLDQNSEFAEVPAKPLTPRQRVVRDELLLLRYRLNLRVAQVPGTSLIDIRFSSSNPQLSADVANAIAATFIEQNIRSRFEGTVQASEWLSKQLANLQVKVEESQARLLDYQKAHNIFGDDKQNITLEKLNDLNRQLTQAEVERILKNTIYQSAAKSGLDTAVLQDAVLSALRQQQAELQAQLAQLSNQFGSAYPKVQEAQSRLVQMEKSYQEQLAIVKRKLYSDYEAAEKREQLLRAALESQKAETEKLGEDAIQFRILRQEADSNRMLYDGLLQKLNEASLMAGLNSSNITIIDPARPPLGPSRPNVPRNLGFALLIGILGGVAGAFALEALDSTVRTPEQAERITGVPAIGLIPAYESVSKEGMQASRFSLFRKTPTRATATPMSKIAFLQPKSEISEAYRALRTSILLSSVGHPPGCILVTSSLPQDGKTVTSINTAIVLAQQGKRVLLVDADLRRPSVHKGLDIPRPKLGLTNVLTGGCQPEDAIISCMQPNLFVLPAGPLAPQPSELLSSALMRDLLAKWRLEYDHIVVDSPPVLSVTDAVLLSVTVDVVLFVARSGQTTNAALRRSRELLEYVKAPVMGLVINAINLDSPDYYYYYYSGSRYGGYYGDKSSPVLGGRDKPPTPSVPDQKS